MMVDGKVARAAAQIFVVARFCCLGLATVRGNGKMTFLLFFGS
jgi:hypothetical protein